MRGMTLETRTGCWMVTAAPTPLCSRSGAMTVTVPTAVIASAKHQMPGVYRPSSLVTKMFMEGWEGAGVRAEA